MIKAFDSRRRLILSAGGGLLLTATLLRRANAASEVEIAMAGTANGSQVWFRPRGLLIQPGQLVRWVNQDAGNVHTTTSYDPSNKKPQRIPDGAKGWNSDYLMPGQSFSMTFTVPGVYDYFCLPHEHAGMVGRLIVGTADTAQSPYAGTDAQLPAAALQALPSVVEILKGQPID
ncbi:cupredoxin domain-containing protein [Castellaniella sp.]|uniref:cupredoxin domain-containing protein n=1 Tax=Castellaniella sp. TaxID=1955812 RepID=UPI002AFF5908|nr:plastocyanin/azurin family copper-binding protein [Castellaniella sp.]